MTTTTFNYNAATRNLGVLPQAVYLKARWGDDWVAAPEYHCEQALWTMGNDIPTATLVRDYGTTRLPGESSYSTRSRTEITGYFVLIEFATHNSGFMYWLGFVESIDSDSAAIDGAGLMHGTQRFNCYGLERAMDWIKIDTTVWKLASDTFRGNATATFNKQRQPNRSSTKATNSVTTLAGYVFETAQADAEYWTIRDIVEYLIAWHPLKDSTGGSTLLFAIQDLTNVFTLSFQPEWSPEGYTLRSALNHFLAPQNLLGWYLKYAPSGNPVSDPWNLTIVIVSIASSTITLPSSATQPIAAQLAVIQADADPLTTIKLSDSGLQTVDQVRVRGAKKQFVFTSYLTQSSGADRDTSTEFLVPAWTSSEETEVVDGATAEVGYGDLTDDQKKRANARARDRYPHVFAKYKRNLKWACVDWNGNAVFGENEDEEPIKPIPHTIQIQEHLPLYALVDYEPIAAEVDETLGSQWHSGYLSNKLWLKLVDKGRLFDSWHVGDLNRGLESKDETPFPEVEFTVEDDGESLLLRVTNAEQITINNHSDQADFPADETLHRRMVNPMESLVTVAVTADEYCEGTYPGSLPSNRDAIRVSTFYAGNNFQHVTIVGDETLIRLDHSGNKIEAGGGVVRDHSEALEDVARIIYEWFGTVRRNLVMQSQRLDSRWILGQLVTTTKEGGATATVNSPVAKIQINSPRALNSRPATPVMIVTTQVSQIDWQRSLQDMFGG